MVLHGCMKEGAPGILYPKLVLKRWHHQLENKTAVLLELLLSSSAEGLPGNPKGPEIGLLAVTEVPLTVFRNWLSRPNLQISDSVTSLGDVAARLLLSTL